MGSFQQQNVAVAPDKTEKLSRTNDAPTERCNWGGGNELVSRDRRTSGLFRQWVQRPDLPSSASHPDVKIAAGPFFVNLTANDQNCGVASTSFIDVGAAKSIRA